MTTAAALETFLADFALMITEDYPEALGLIDLARQQITGATSLDDLALQIELFYDDAEATSREDGLDHITASDLRANMATFN